MSALERSEWTSRKWTAVTGGRLMPPTPVRVRPQDLERVDLGAPAVQQRHRAMRRKQARIEEAHGSRADDDDLRIWFQVASQPRR